MIDARGQYARLARARARDDEQMPTRMDHRPALLGVEPLKCRVRTHCVAAGGDTLPRRPLTGAGLTLVSADLPLSRCPAGIINFLCSRNPGAQAFHSM